MEPHLTEAEFFHHTVLHPAAAAATILLAVVMFVLPRRYVIPPMLLMACFIPQAQRIDVAGIDFDLLRILVVVGWTRVLFQGEWKSLRLGQLDTAIVFWVISGVVMMCVLNSGSAQVIINRLGWAFDILGMYFLFRVLIRDWGDLDRLAMCLCLISIPVMFMFLLEYQTGRNLFSVFGGVPEFTMLREGRLRCQGAFSHPILAGCFWTATIPLLVSIWWRGGIYRAIAVAASVACITIVLLCGSSTPICSLAIGAIAAGLFPLRYHMRIIRWSILFALVALHLVMKAPVWHLLARIDFAGGSTGWQRFHLVDEAIRHFGEWWALGRVNYMDGWGWDLFDIPNQYILQGMEGGLLPLIGLISVISIGFREVGRLWRRASCRGETILAWSLGSALLIHACNFMGVSYFGQMNLIWYLLLSIIGSLSTLKIAPLGERGYVNVRKVSIAAIPRTRGRRILATHGQLRWVR